MILLTGATGLLGRYVHQKLDEEVKAIGSEVDLRDFNNCLAVLDGVDKVIHLAGKVGGILDNRNKPGEYFYDNASMGINLIEACRLKKVSKILIAGSVCSYPKNTHIPFQEDNLWRGYPEETNAAYAIAKKSLLVMLQSYYKQYGLRSCYPLLSNLYGPGDKSDHVIPDLIKKFKIAVNNGSEKVIVYGTGSPKREFLYVDDAADAIVKMFYIFDEPIPINIGSEEIVTIKELVNIVAKLTGFKGKIVWDITKPDGQLERKTDLTKLKLLSGWKAKMPLKEGIRRCL